MSEIKESGCLNSCILREGLTGKIEGSSIKGTEPLTVAAKMNADLLNSALWSKVSGEEET